MNSFGVGDSAGAMLTTLARSGAEFCADILKDLTQEQMLRLVQAHAAGNRQQMADIIYPKIEVNLPGTINPLPLIQPTMPVSPPILMEDPRCPKCGIEAKNATHYVCGQSDCPWQPRVTCGASIPPTTP